jgi:hypothetical protein
MTRGVRRFQVDNNHMTGTIPMFFRYVESKCAVQQYGHWPYI